ncbi:hypothetical protein SAMN04487910_1408 [Aquimarina amphilecti]|uniref:Uncharacterized protein n=1 Tax=Aquimarina amphilecti TaxID=1038014 RepID=A0A1H7KRY5_AQUAM|nr:hypothetical protein [Aquimarina amphilecti]SEK89324.1 hypothetical protein SAMN04487910_1408 [Aquimarina amphilecti]
MKKSQLKGKLTLEKMNIAKLNNLSKIRGGNFMILDLVDSINNNDDDDDDDGTLPTWPNTNQGDQGN